MRQITLPLSREERAYLKRERDKATRALCRSVGQGGSLRDGPKRTKYWPPLVTVQMNGEVRGTASLAYAVARY